MMLENHQQNNEKEKKQQTQGGEGGEETREGHRERSVWSQTARHRLSSHKQTSCLALMMRRKERAPEARLALTLAEAPLTRVAAGAEDARGRNPDEPCDSRRSQEKWLPFLGSLFNSRTSRGRG